MVSTTTSVDNTGGPAAAQTSKMDPAMVDLQSDTDGYGAVDEDCTSIILVRLVPTLPTGIRALSTTRQGPLLENWGECSNVR